MTTSNPRPPAAGRLALRAAFLVADLFLIITAYYQIKPASRSLFIEHLGSARLPYVWIGTALILGLAMSFYQYWVARYPRERVVLTTCAAFAVALVVFRLLWLRPGEAVSVAFYVFTDIMGVVLVEQFWSLANSLYTTRDGKRWYGIIGTGGLAGGVAGGAIAAAIIRFTPLQTPDLLLVGAGLLGLIVLLTRAMVKLGLYTESRAVRPERNHDGLHWSVFRQNRYLALIAAMLLLAQLAEPVVEYQFLSAVEQAYPLRESRTEYLSIFFSILGLVSVAVNLALTPLVHRLFGVIAGLLVQPLALAASAAVFVTHPGMLTAEVMKVCDRGLSYSINRASKELLYVPIDPVLIYQAKAWIDMFGYRIFKVIGSVLILALSQWGAWKASVPDLAWLTLVICAIWTGFVVVAQFDYGRLLRLEAASRP